MSKNENMDLEGFIVLLESLKDLPVKEKSFRVAGIISEYVMKKKGIYLIIVGGLSVEIYTDGGYMTKDIDFVGPNHEDIVECLSDLGFQAYHNSDPSEVIEKIDKSEPAPMRIHPKLLSLVEIPGDSLKGADINRVNTLITADGFSVNVIGQEDIIMDRIRAHIHYKEATHYDYIRQLIERHHGALDLKYIEAQLLGEELKLFRVILNILESEGSPQTALDEIRLELGTKKHLNTDYGRIASSFEHLIFFTIATNVFVGFTTVPALNIYTYDSEEDSFEPISDIIDGMTFHEVEAYFKKLSLQTGKDFSEFVRLVRNSLKLGKTK